MGWGGVGCGVGWVGGAGGRGAAGGPEARLARDSRAVAAWGLLRWARGQPRGARGQRSGLEALEGGEATCCGLCWCGPWQGQLRAPYSDCREASGGERHTHKWGAAAAGRACDGRTPPTPGLPFFLPSFPDPAAHDDPGGCDNSSLPLLLLPSPTPPPPHAPPRSTMTLVDLPGITRVPVGDQPSDIEVSKAQPSQPSLSQPQPSHSPAQPQPSRVWPQPSLPWPSLFGQQQPSSSVGTCGGAVVSGAVCLGGAARGCAACGNMAAGPGLPRAAAGALGPEASARGLDSSERPGS